MKTKTLQIKLTEDEYGAVIGSAKRSGESASQHGARLILAAVVAGKEKGLEQEAAVLAAVRSFRGIFCEAMEMNLRGKLTVERFKNLVEAWGRDYA